MFAASTISFLHYKGYRTLSHVATVHPMTESTPTVKPSFTETAAPGGLKQSGYLRGTARDKGQGTPDLTTR